MQDEQAQQERQPWDQMEGEPDKWYGRFQVYLQLGVTRTLKAATHTAGEQAKNRPYAWSGQWSDMSRRWRWRARAHAWDVHQRELLALSERNTRLALHSRRIERMEDYMDAVCEVLDNAHMTAADENLARAWLPQMRVFLRDLLVAERQEFERGDYETGDPDSSLIITADDLRAAQRALAASTGHIAGGMSAPDVNHARGMTAPDSSHFTDMTAPCVDHGAGVPCPRQNYAANVTASHAGHTAMTSHSPCVDHSAGATHATPNAPAAPPPPAAPTTGRTLLVCVGAGSTSGSALMLDLAALRAVRAATGLKFMRLLGATRPRFDNTLRRERGLGRPIELLHLALHASPEGVQFADGVADGNWLSERLFGVRIMLLASCESDSVGDWLGVIPHVITLSEEISHQDAAVLTQHFWHNIGLNMEPGPALDETLTHCPPAVSEYVVRHW